MVRKHKFKKDIPPYMNYCICGRSKFKEIVEGETFCKGKPNIIIIEKKR